MKLLTLLLLPYFGYSQTSLTKDNIDKFSLASHRILACKGNTPLFTGSSFIMKAKTKYFIITNYHMISDYDFYKNGKNHWSKDSTPDNILIKMYSKQIGAFINQRIPLYTNAGVPLYKDFLDNHGDLFDIIAIPFVDFDTTTTPENPVIRHTKFNGLHLYPGLELFIVGFPEDYQNSSYPIWKSGRIASDPSLVNFGFPSFLIDATTRKGMSGSPVFFRGSEFADDKGTANFGALKTMLYGIYSAQNFNSEIGVVISLDVFFEKLYNSIP